MAVSRLYSIDELDGVVCSECGFVNLVPVERVERIHRCSRCLGVFEECVVV